MALLFLVLILFYSLGVSGRRNSELLLPFVTGAIFSLGNDSFLCFIECLRIHVGNIKRNKFFVLLYWSR